MLVEPDVDVVLYSTSLVLSLSAHAERVTVPIGVDRDVMSIGRRSTEPRRFIRTTIRLSGSRGGSRMAHALHTTSSIRVTILSFDSKPIVEEYR
jgi:hypothetical protein